ncbi:hypothetical protein RHSIM_Rhsim04G0143200 [Rhododendron simsii]|uniref:Uncharacterized protein n=1 Tax=Rhododendron simsii TaxID=118357 RepID=A0A834H3R2_RHOSS|nr:hypothetical protein RHSIM_Rhsim04G0143200 [Rhododendron simsii]
MPESSTTAVDDDDLLLAIAFVKKKNDYKQAQNNLFEKLIYCVQLTTNILSGAVALYIEILSVHTPNFRRLHPKVEMDSSVLPCGEDIAEWSGKSSVFIDKRAGEQNDELGEFDKAILRSQHERQLKLNKKSKYNLSDGEEDEFDCQNGLQGRDDF